MNLNEMENKLEDLKKIQQAIEERNKFLSDVESLKQTGAKKYFIRLHNNYHTNANVDINCLIMLIQMDIDELTDSSNKIRKELNLNDIDT